MGGETLSGGDLRGILDPDELKENADKSWHCPAFCGRAVGI
jgi:hypothetical protein